MNLASIIDGHPDDAVALVSRGEPTTYGALRDEVDCLRAALIRLGVAPGDRIAIVAANTPFFVTAHLAALGAGAVVVPLNPASPAAELRRELTAVRAKVAFVGPSGRDAIAGVDRAAVGLEHVIVSPGLDLDGATGLGDLDGAPPAPVVDRFADDLAVLIFTAGTAGSPKAAMLSHGNLLANIEQMQRHPGRALESSDVVLGALPLFHIFGLNVMLGLTLYAGGSVVLVERFDPSSSLDTIVAREVTLIAGAPPMFAAWAGLHDAPADAMATVRLAVSGASALSDEVASAFGSRFGVEIFEGYGLTEASPTVTSSVVGEEPKPGSIGVPIPGVQVRLVDEEGEEALVGDAGEIWVRGPNVFHGYFENTEATNQALTNDGWLRTGDIAVADDDGYLFIVDRAKDLIIVSGFNVFPAEVEEALMEHPGIARAAVVGVANPHSGESVKAFVVAAPGNHLEEDQIIDFCAERLARYKCPTKVMLVGEIPEGLGGKLLRRALR
ncbi:MAG TPA: AMP-binding protein [Acidimicrobiales bacterium]|nr:AMP-binding protein [Acidimicrobiales bacterium]